MNNDMLDRIVRYRSTGTSWKDITNQFEGYTLNALRKAYKRYINKQEKSLYGKKGIKMKDSGKNVKVFIIGDTHFPFHAPKAYKKMMKLIAKEKPTHVIQIGDLLDQYVFSKYTRSLEITPKSEIKRGLECAEKMWEDIAKLLPKAKLFQILGNHDVRLSKRIKEKMPELAEFFDLKDWYKFDRVKVLDSDRDYLELDGVIYVHGWLSKSIDHAKHFNKPCVHGHTHRALIQTAREGLWSMDVGFLADKDSLPLQYTASKFSHWVTACGVVENGQPRLFFLHD